MRQFSTTNTYEDSNGNRWTSSQIRSKSQKAKNEVKENSDGACEITGLNVFGLMQQGKTPYIDPAHTISEKWAKENGQVQLCWDKRNIRMLARHIHIELDNKSAEERKRIYETEHGALVSKSSMAGEKI